MNDQDKNKEELKNELQELQHEYNSLKVTHDKDITDYKFAKDQLQQQMKNLDAVFESSPVAMFVIDNTTNIVMTNLAFTVMCGGSESDILQHRPGNALRCIHSHSDPRGCGYAKACKFCNVRNGVEGLIASGGSLHGAELELELTRNEEPGKYWMNIGVEPFIMNGQGHWCIAMDDVTQRKKAEEALRDNELKFRLLFETSVDAILLFTEGAWDDCNAGALRVFGCTREQIIGKNPSMFSPPMQPDGRSSEEEAIKLITLAYEGKPQFFEWEHCRADATTFAAEVALNRLDLGGKSYILAIVRDVSERKKAKEELQMRAAKLQATIDEAPVGVAMVGMNKNFMNCNTAFSHFLGYTEEEMKKMTIADITFPEDVMIGMDDLRAIVAGEIKSSHVQKRYVCKDGKVVWGAVNISLIRNQEGKPLYFLPIIQDITESKLAEEEIRKLNTELEQRVADRTSELAAANKELEAFSYSVSHDLRAPLRHISGYVDLLTTKFHDALPEKAQHYLDSIAGSSHEMGILIDNLLQFSRTGRAEMRKSENDMNDIVNAVIKSITQEQSDRLISWNVNKLPIVQCDSALLKQVWINLLGNAVKYSRTRDNTKIDIGVKEEQNEYIFFVRDNGVGFEMQYAHKLFGVFQRLHPTGEFEGSGIGLANVRQIILRHGGRTWAEAELDKGATFYFSLTK